MYRLFICSLILTLGVVLTIPASAHAQEPTPEATIEAPSEPTGGGSDLPWGWIAAGVSFVFGVAIFITQAQKISNTASSIWTFGANTLARLQGAERVRWQLKRDTFEHRCSVYHRRITDLEKRVADSASSDQHQWEQLTQRLESLRDEYDAFQAEFE